MNKPFVEKYRPQDFDQVEGNREVINCLQKITETKIIPNMLLYGPPGTGKTTCIRILSSILPNTSVLELNASDERGISIVRNTIKEFASTYSKTIKLVILDEADFMTRDAQNALRRIMEDYSANTRFCLIANYPKKIIPPILSRCSKFRFSPVCDMGKRISTICDAENIQIDEQGIQFLIKTSYGDMRKVVNDIQGIIKAYGIINKHTVLKFNGIMSDEEYKDVFDILTQRKYDEILMQLEALKESKSVDLLSIITYITDYVLQSKLKNKLLLLKKMSEIECRLNAGCSEEVQMNGLIGAFVLYR